MELALRGARIFTGDTFLDDHAVVIEGRHIVKLCPVGEIEPGTDARDLGGGLLAPGFIDVQVNGGGGALLNDRPTVDTVRQIAQSHRRFGTTGLLPTIITDAPEILDSAIAAVAEARANLPNVLGIHIEGPFLDMARKGAHDPKFIRAMTQADADHILAISCGSVMLTVAPNTVPQSFISWLAAHGILVSLGHAEARFDEAKAALAAGACAFTHLFNAMSQMTGREPGMVGAALGDTASFIGIIADGFHVHDETLKISLRATAPDRFMLVSDAMSSAAGGPSSFALQGRPVTLHDGRLQLDDGTLAGSNLTMDAALRNCISNLGVPLGDALRMTSLNPARFLRRAHELGRIVPGHLASLVHLDGQLNVSETWVEGA